jgi:hypothetical protein
MLRKSEPAVPALLLSGKQKIGLYLCMLYQWPDTGIICTSKKQGCHPPFITPSWWHVNEWRKRSQTCNHHSPQCHLKWVWYSGQAYEGIHLCEINNVLVFETVPRVDWCCLCKCSLLWLLKYPNWQQKKNHSRPLYLLSLGD